MASSAEQTSRLERRSDVECSTEWPTLLVGNGASVNLWNDFGYVSLYEQADLSTVARAVFAYLDVTNFELVLEAIHHAHVVVKELGTRPMPSIPSTSKSRTPFFGAVQGAHINWSEFTTNQFDKIASVIQNHDAVYTTNYDLCMYWARLDAVGRIKKGTDVIDFLWNDDYMFDPANVATRHRTAMYHLHGSIHLWQDDRGNNGKWTSANRGNLLSLARNYPPGASKWPLFVSEGSSKAKLQTIGRSPYLPSAWTRSDLIRGTPLYSDARSANKTSTPSLR